MNHKFVFVCAAALLSAAAFAEDAKPKKGVEARFESIDKNADGKLTQEELAGDSKLSGMFSTLDRDGDGAVTLEEFRAKVQVKPGSSSSSY